MLSTLSAVGKVQGYNLVNVSSQLLDGLL